MRQGCFQLALTAMAGCCFVEEDDLKEAVVELTEGFIRGFVVGLVQFQGRE